jgi:phospholipid/cholesterol/gamma-HCH transport system ATP-binding protein
MKDNATMAKEQSRPVIQVKNLWKAYGKHQVLKGLNLELNEGETLVIIGRSGVGKSVLLRQVIGIEKPDQGTVSVNNQPISGLSGAELYRAVKNMGMLFQGAALFDSMTVGENAAFYLRQHGDPRTGQPLSEKEIRQWVDDALNMVGLSGTQGKMPSDLSGGMRKRAALARLIVYRPKILLYDEPTTGLDPVTAMQINKLILKTQKELSATSIVVTHDLRSACEVGDRIALHHEGVIAYNAPKAEFMKIEDPLVKSFFDNVSIDQFRAENHRARSHE